MMSQPHWFLWLICLRTLLLYTDCCFIFVTFYLLIAICHLLFIIFVIIYYLFVICYLLFVTCYLVFSTVFYHYYSNHDFFSMQLWYLFCTLSNKIFQIKSMITNFCFLSVPPMMSGTCAVGPYFAGQILHCNLAEL